jgi:hypothetical protein
MAVSDDLRERLVALLLAAYAVGPRPIADYEVRSMAE